MDPVDEAIIKEAIAHSSPDVCKVMARFCHRLSQVTDTTDEVRGELVEAANRWHDAAVAKLDAKRAREARLATRGE